MKTKIIVKPHSFVDVITNSSTEMFVANRVHTVKEVKEIIGILKETFYYTGEDEIYVEKVDDVWDKEYYGEDAIIISYDQHAPLALPMHRLIEKIFDTGERNEDA